MTDIKLNPQQQEEMVAKLQKYFERELDYDLGQFDAEFLLSFFAEQMGGYYYNQALQDAQAIFSSRMALVEDDLYAIEKDVS